MKYYFHKLLPKKLLSSSMYFLSRIENKNFKNFIIKVFMKITGANLNDAKRTEIEDYSSLLDFFTRELKEGARPIQGGDNSIICPVDGRVAHIGDITNGQIFQIKGHSYKLTELIKEYADNYQDGLATTIYLAPFDYHRIHMPMDGELIRAKYIPGELNSVSISLLDKISGLFAKNERVVLEFKSNDGSTFIMVLVGAVNVGSIETVMHGEIAPNNYKVAFELDCDKQRLKKGEELGRFNLGSTIILITKNNHHNWVNIKDGDKTVLGQVIGEIK